MDGYTLKLSIYTIALIESEKKKVPKGTDFEENYKKT